MSNYHARIMNIPAYPDAPFEYKEGHRDACHAAASIALEAETDIVWLRAEVERLRELVHEAYIEGFEQHCVDFHYQDTPPESQMAWQVSDTRAALAGEGEEHSSTNCRTLTGQVNHDYCDLCRRRAVSAGFALVAKLDASLAGEGDDDG